MSVPERLVRLRAEQKALLEVLQELPKGSSCDINKAKTRLAEVREGIEELTLCARVGT